MSQRVSPEEGRSFIPSDSGETRVAAPLRHLHAKKSRDGLLDHPGCDVIKGEDLTSGDRFQREDGDRTNRLHEKRPTDALVPAFNEGVSVAAGDRLGPGCSDPIWRCHGTQDQAQACFATFQGQLKGTSGMGHRLAIHLDTGDAVAGPRGVVHDNRDD